MLEKKQHLFDKEGYPLPSAALAQVRETDSSKITDTLLSETGKIVENIELLLNRSKN